MSNDNLTNQQINAVEDKGLSLKEIFHIIKKHFIAIALFIVAGIAGGIGYSIIEAPEYVANASLVAMPDSLNTTNAAEYNGMSMIAETFVSFVSENVVLDMVVENLKPTYDDVTTREIKNGMSVSNTNLIIKVKYFCDEPQKAIDYTNAIVESVVEASQIKLDDTIVKDAKGNDVPNYKYKLLAGNIQVVSNAKTATRNSHRMKDLAIGGAIGLVCAAAYTIIFELLDNSFRSEKEVETELDLPILAVVPFYNIEEETKKGGNK